MFAQSCLCISPHRHFPQNLCVDLYDIISRLSNLPWATGLPIGSLPKTLARLHSGPSLFMETDTNHVLHFAAAAVREPSRVGRLCVLYPTTKRRWRQRHIPSLDDLATRWMHEKLRFQY